MRSNHRNDPAQQQNCEMILELIPDYAFGLTAPDETRLVESNLPHCSDAAAQLADFQRLQGEILAGVSQIEPSPQLEERLMAAIAAIPTTTAAPVKSRRFPFKLNVAWIAAAAALFALIVSNIYWVTRVNNLTEAQSMLVTATSAPVVNAFVLNNTSGLRWVRLPASQQNSDTSAFMMWNAESQIGLLYAHGFPKLAVGTTYQLWLTRGNEKVSAGTFRVDQDGKGALLFHVTESIDEYTWARITAEPENGSDAPTGTIVVIGKLSA